MLETFEHTSGIYQGIYHSDVLEILADSWTTVLTYFRDIISVFRYFQNTVKLHNLNLPNIVLLFEHIAVVPSEFLYTF